MSDFKKFVSRNPSSGETLYEGEYDTLSSMQAKIAAARKVQPKWEQVSMEEKRNIFTKFAELVKENADEAARIISNENGKPVWEARMEVNSLVNKVQVVFDAYEERAKTKYKEMSGGRVSVTRFRPHGVMAVLGPFNFPMSMPNSHVMPALYAGNAVIFKPSEKTPLSALYYMELWKKAGLPEGVLQIVFGDAEISGDLIELPGIDGVLFIGSYRAGKNIENKMVNMNRICALEMGGNSPLVIWDYSDIRAAINIAIQSGFISSGQRCSAARRLIVNENIYEEYINELCLAVKNIIVGKSDQSNPEPFMGPLIDEHATDLFLKEYRNLVESGAEELVKAEHLLNIGYNFVSPALLDVTKCSVDDREIFGSMLQVISVSTIDEAVYEANNTKYGLAAGIVTDSKEIYDYFFNNIKSGIVNWNQTLTGSTTVAPFGGIKGSGNYRPAGYLSVDYCLYAIASIESSKAVCPVKLSPGLSF